MGNSGVNKTGGIDPSDPVTGHPPHYFHEMPHEDEERLEKLFNSLDLDGKGKIDIHDLSEALKKAGLHHGYAEVRSFLLNPTPLFPFEADCYVLKHFSI